VCAIIKSKHVKYVAQKELVYPKSHMVLDAQRWAKIVDDFQNTINEWVPQNVKTCKDKWNGINSNYKKIVDYHKGTGHNTYFWELLIDERDNLHFPKQFNHEYYEAIYVF
jgi:hypothetical protein